MKEEIRSLKKRFTIKLVSLLKALLKNTAPIMIKYLLLVVRHTKLRTLFAIAGKRKYCVHHFDAKTAFLNGKLDEVIYYPGQYVFGHYEKLHY